MTTRACHSGRRGNWFINMLQAVPILHATRKHAFHVAYMSRILIQWRMNKNWFARIIYGIAKCVVWLLWHAAFCRLRERWILALVCSSSGELTSASTSTRGKDKTKRAIRNTSRGARARTICAPDSRNDLTDATTYNKLCQTINLGQDTRANQNGHEHTQNRTHRHNSYL